MSGAGARAMIKTNDTTQKDTKLCHARTRSGGLCQKHPIAGKTRCRLHGGLSSGPTTLEGKAACVAAHWKHGRRSKAYVEARKRIWADLRRVERAMKISGLINWTLEWHETWPAISILILFIRCSHTFHYPLAKLFALFSSHYKANTVFTSKFFKS